MVNLFVKHILGVGTTHTGFYGDTSAYYGTVEQQGRLTLHYICIYYFGFEDVFHLKRYEIASWIQNWTLIKRELVAYLESVHVGEFLTGSQGTVTEQVEFTRGNPGVGMAQPLPLPPKPLLKGVGVRVFRVLCRG